MGIGYGEKERGCALGKEGDVLVFLARPRGRDRIGHATRASGMWVRMRMPALFSIRRCLLCVRDVLGLGWKTVS